MLLSHIFWTARMLLHIWIDTLNLFYSQHCSESQFMHETCKRKMLLWMDVSLVSVYPLPLKPLFGIYLRFCFLLVLLSVWSLTVLASNQPLLHYWRPCLLLAWPQHSVVLPFLKHHKCSPPPVLYSCTLVMEAAGSSEKYINLYPLTCITSQKTSLFKDINFKTGAVSLFRLWNAVIDNDQCYSTWSPNLSYQYFKKLPIVQEFCMLNGV